MFKTRPNASDLNRQKDTWLILAGCNFKYRTIQFNPNQNLVHTLALERATFSLSLEANINLLIVVLLYVFYIAP